MKLKTIAPESRESFCVRLRPSLVTQIDHYIAGRNLRRSDVLEKAILAYLSFLEGKEAG